MRGIVCVNVWCLETNTGIQPNDGEINFPCCHDLCISPRGREETQSRRTLEGLQMLRCSLAREVNGGGLRFTESSQINENALLPSVLTSGTTEA